MPPIGSRDVACSEGPYVRSFEHLLQLLDVGNDLLSVHSASIIQQKRREVKRNFVNPDDSGTKVAVDSGQQKLHGRYMYHGNGMAFPLKVCSVCSEEFELKPDKPGFANRCPACSEPERATPLTKPSMDADERKTLMETNEARRRAMRELLYRKDS